MRSRVRLALRAHTQSVESLSLGEPSLQNQVAAGGMQRFKLSLPNTAGGLDVDINVFTGQVVMAISRPTGGAPAVRCWHFRSGAPHHLRVAVV